MYLRVNLNIKRDENIDEIYRNIQKQNLLQIAKQTD